MLIKNAVKILKRSRSVCLYGESGNYWLSDGAVMFPVPEFEELGQESVMAILSVPEKEAEKWSYAAAPLPGRFLYNGVDPAEIPLNVSDLTVRWQGVSIQPLNSETGSVFVQAFYTDVFQKDEKDVTFALRKDKNGEIYIAVKQGLMLVGILMPLVQIANAAQFTAELLRQSFMLGERFREDEDGQMEMEGTT